MLLIDGHNLIGKMPNISLSDPDDELKLLRALENYHALHPHETMLVVFDPGRDGAGGWSNTRSSSAGIAVRFAPRGTTADAVIARILREQRQPRSITVVSSDNAVRKSARERGAKTITSEDFVAKLREGYHARTPKLPRDSATNEKPSESDAAYWSQFFKEPKPAASKSPISKAKGQISAAPRQSGKPARKNSPNAEAVDLEYWLRIFGEPADNDAKPTAPTGKPETQNDIEYWLREFSRKRE